MAEKLKIIPLGGLDEIGKNITVLEYGKDMIVVDCGVGFPDEDMYGVDLVIPDFTYLVQNAKKLRGMFITHGHEDHIGSTHLDPNWGENFRLFLNDCFPSQEGKLENQNKFLVYAFSLDLWNYSNILKVITKRLLGWK